MDKETVLIEPMTEDLVTTCSYDEDTGTIIEPSSDIINRAEAYQNYNVVGEIVNGEINLFNDNSNDKEDYSEFFSGDDYYED